MFGFRLRQLMSLSSSDSNILYRFSSDNLLFYLHFFRIVLAIPFNLSLVLKSKKKENVVFPGTPEHPGTPKKPGTPLSLGVVPGFLGVFRDVPVFRVSGNITCQKKACF